MIKLGINKPQKMRQTTTDPFNGDLVLTMLAAETRTRGMEFSKGAVEAMHLWERTSPENVTPTFTNTMISVAHDDATNEVFVFVNNGLPGVRQINVGQTTLGFRDKDFYELLVKNFNLDETTNNNLSLTPYEQDDYPVNMFKIAGIYTTTENNENANTELKNTEAFKQQLEFVNN